MHGLPVAALHWDPQLRGALIVLVGAAVLVGSVFMLLATNVGLRMGVLLSVAGLTGWLVLLNVIWLMAPLGNGPIGYKGVAGGWKIAEIVQGDLVSHSGTRAITGTPDRPQTQFPDPKAGWQFLPTGNPLLASAQPVADAALTSSASGGTPTFTTTQDYVEVAAYSKGGHNYLVNVFGYKIYWRIRKHQIYLKHQPHYIVIRVQKSVASVTLAGKAATLPSADPTQPLYSVVMLKNDGSLRLPPLLIGGGALILFLLSVERLHHREKEIERRRAEDEAGGPPGGRPTRELQPA